jgi:spore coat polysaccharide biosynthesis protein SpsF (cytidylyltransferase family)/RimJ/RimL family protein N-acetyltransferase
VVVATSTLDRDDAVAAIAQRCGVGVVRGSEQDVLSRFVTALDEFPASTVVRLTADCPLTDPAVVAAVLDRHHEAEADYTSNVLPRSFPKGLDVEVMSAVALRTADREATEAAEREHVTPFLYRRPERFRLVNLDSTLAAGDERWTVDTADDLERVRAILATIGDPLADWQTFLAAFGRTAPVPAAGTVVLRPARSDDRDFVLAVRNESESVRWSISGSTVAPRDHGAWFTAVLDDPGRRMRIAEVDGRRVGFARVDVEGGTGSVSIALAPDARGRGLGRAVLAALVDDVHADCQLRELVASVHADNVRSLHAFTAVGWAEIGPDAAPGFLRLVRAA